MDQTLKMSKSVRIGKVFRVLVIHLLIENWRIKNRKWNMWTIYHYLPRHLLGFENPTTALVRQYLTVEKIIIIIKSTALSFYVTKRVLVGPKWFWSYQIDLDLTKFIWSQPKWNGHNKNELVRSKLWFILVENHNLDLTNSFWSRPFHFGCDQIIMVKSKSIWSHQNHFEPTKTVLVT